jgi:hypothetical protein
MRGKMSSYRGVLYILFTLVGEVLTSIDRSEPWPMLQPVDLSHSWESLEVPPPEFSAVDLRNPIDRLCPRLTRGSITYGFKYVKEQTLNLPGI